MIYLKSTEFFARSDLPITTELRAPQDSFPEHAHAFEELMVVSGGSGTHVINDVPMNLSKNFICFVNRNDRHLFENVDNLHLSNVLFDPAKLSVDSAIKKYIPTRQSEESSGWFINDSCSQHVNQIIARLDSESHSNTAESKIICQSLFNLLLVELSRGRVKDISQGSDEEKVISLLAYLHSHYAESNTLEELAYKAKISPKLLTKNLKILTGMSYNRCLNYIRLSKSLEALRYSEKSITEIAYDVGYHDSNYFSTKFKQLFNTTPRDVRLGVSVILTSQ
ncbi:helix-turn-helix domain-containing protein [Photobacterium rosenbergii]|uniref:Helix-turn-helix domain-containing protein n=1 Tax=Photobacterium rosenbergii TaxID=294936 RepID=A0ABU3ZNQ4_9GAMM|nr:helix-turn-helix domain-containing protein [Photobacterium rosenbergii]MDV5171623.1 helix-turn-helix domain-containing protein [Photobacterium rosenbergii]